MRTTGNGLWARRVRDRQRLEDLRAELRAADEGLRQMRKRPYSVPCGADDAMYDRRDALAAQIAELEQAV